MRHFYATRCKSGAPSGTPSPLAVKRRRSATSSPLLTGDLAEVPTLAPMSKRMPFAAISGFLFVALVATLVLGFAGAFDRNGLSSSDNGSPSVATSQLG